MLRICVQPFLLNACPLLHSIALHLLHISLPAVHPTTHQEEHLPPLPEAEVRPAVAASNGDRQPPATKSSKPRKVAKAPKLTSKTAALMGKWQAAKKELQSLDSDNDGTIDGETAVAANEAKRLREAEEWRSKQLRSGTAVAENPNFAPLAGGDWRDRVGILTNKKKQDRPFHAAPQASTSQSTDALATTTITTAPDRPSSSGISGDKDKAPDLVALSAGLPHGWRAMWDSGRNAIYFGNLLTKVRAACLFHSGSPARQGQISCFWSLMLDEKCQENFVGFGWLCVLAAAGAHMCRVKRRGYPALFALVVFRFLSLKQSTWSGV
jgi:cell division protein FtsN